MNILIAILIRIIEVMFVAGVIGSAIVVLLTSIEDFKMLFEKDSPPGGKCRREGSVYFATTYARCVPATSAAAPPATRYLPQFQTATPPAGSRKSSPARKPR